MSSAVHTLQDVRTQKTGRDPRGIAVSVIVPVSERPESLPDLYREYSKPIRALGRSFEFIFVAEPWLQHLVDPLTDIARQGEPIRVFCGQQTLGETALVRHAVAQCKGDVIVTLPAYHRVEAQALPDLIREVDAGADIAVARRWPRRDPLINRLHTRIFHALIAPLAAGKLHDVACGVRAMRRVIFDEVPLYGDFFRFLPLVALRLGYSVVEVSCPQHERDTSRRVYSPGVYLRRAIDVLGLFFLLRFTEKPLRFFGLIGAVSASVGGGILGLVLLQRFGGQGIADRPLLLLGVLLVVLGVQAIALGLIGEIIVYLGAGRRPIYRVLDDEDT